MDLKEMSRTAKEAASQMIYDASRRGSLSKSQGQTESWLISDQRIAEVYRSSRAMSVGGRLSKQGRVVLFLIFAVCILLVVWTEGIIAASLGQSNKVIKQNVPFSKAVLVRVAQDAVMSEELAISKVREIAAEMQLRVASFKKISAAKKRRNNPYKNLRDSGRSRRAPIYRVSFEGGSLPLDKGKLEKFARKVEGSGFFDLAEVERVYSIEEEAEETGQIFNREYLGGVSALPWWLDMIGASGAWGVTRGDSSVTVAIIDTGCDMECRALSGAIWKNRLELLGNEGADDDGNGYVDDVAGWDFVSAPSQMVAEGEDGASEDNDPKDFSGHGTHLAGIVASSDQRAMGLAPDCRVMILRAGFEASNGMAMFLEGDVIEAIEYATAMGADIINLSFGGSEAELLHQAIVDAVQSGVVVVGAAGNFGTDDPVYPAYYDEVLGVAAADSSGSLASFSCRGDWIACSAPGVSIFSTTVGGFEAKSGTSMAAAFVSATAALIKSAHPQWSGDEIKAQIINTAHPLCRADKAILTEPEPIVEYAGSSYKAKRQGELYLIEIASRLKNSWKRLNEVSVCIGVLDKRVHFAGDSIAYEENVLAGKEMEETFVLKSGIRDWRSAIVIPFEMVIDADGRSFSFRDSVTIDLNGGTQLLSYKVAETSGDGDGAMDPSERGRIDVVLKNMTGLQRAVRIEPLSEGWPFSGISFAPESLEVAPHSVASFCVEFSIEDDQSIEGRYPLRFSIEDDRGVEVKELPVWVSFRGVDGLERDVSLQGSSGHSGFFKGSRSTPLGIAWKSVFMGRGKIISQPLIADGTCFVLRDEEDRARVYALNGDTGKELWEREFFGGSYFESSALAYSNGVICVPTGSGLVALFHSSGETIWSVGAEELGLSGSSRFGAPSIYKDRVYATVQSMEESGRGYLIALDLFTGDLEWMRKVGEGVYMPGFPPSCDAGLIYTVRASGEVLGFREDGTLAWSFVSGEAPASPLVSTDGLVIFRGAQGSIVCLHGERGDVVLEKRVAMSPEGPPCVAEAKGKEGIAEKRVVSVARSKDAIYVEAFSLADGARCMDARLPFDFASGAAANEKAVFVAGEGGRLAALEYDAREGGAGNIRVVETGEGTKEASFANGRAIPGTPFLAGSRAYVTYHGVDEDWLLCFEIGSGSEPTRMLLSNSPNPFNASTTISFSLKERSDVSLEIFDVSGRLLKVLHLGECSPGTKEVIWDGRNLRGEPVASGVYFCRIRADGVCMQRKMVLLR